MSGVFGVQVHGSEDNAFRLARNLFRDAGDYATASELFAEFIGNYPESQQLAEARLMLARSYSRSGRCAQAISAFETFYQEHPGHLEVASARRERAACLAVEGRYEEAARAYQDVQRRFSASEFAAQALLEAAANYTQAGLFEQAVRAYRQTIDEYRTQPQAHAARFRLARLLFAGGHSEPAQQLLGEIVAAEPAASQAPDALLLSGRIDLLLGNQEAAFQKFARLQQRFRASSQADSAYLEQAGYLYDRRQFLHAEEVYQQALQQIAAPELKRRALLGLADARRQSRQTAPALAAYRQLLENLPADHPIFGQARLGLAIVTGQTGQFAQAVGAFKELIQEDSEASEAIAALRELGVLYQQRGDHALAISWYRRYLQAAPQAADRDQVEFALAGIYAAEGDYESAVVIYRSLAEGGSPLASEAQFALAQTFQKGGFPRAALREYGVLLEQFPASRHTREARDRFEYLGEFTVIDAASLDQALQQAWLDELSGVPRQRIQLDVARALYAHRDFANAARAFEHYAAAHPGGTHYAEAQYFLAESLLRLARQRRLERRSEEADSLHRLALQEYRILSHAEKKGDWVQQAKLQLIQLEAEVEPDSLRKALLENNLIAFLENYPDSPYRDRVLLELAEARRERARQAPDRWPGAVAAYRQLLEQFPDSPQAPRALLGLGLSHARQGEHEAAIQVLEELLQSYPNSPQAPEVLFELGQILLSQGRLAEAMTRYQELHWAYPTFAQRRIAQQQLADIHFQLGEYRAAIELYRQLTEGREFGAEISPIHYRLAQSYHRHGELTTALDLYRQLLTQVEPQVFWDSIYFSQALLLAELDRPEEAISQFLRLRENFPQSSLVSEAAVQAAHLSFDLGNYAQAVRLYQPLLAEIQDPQAYGQAVVALFRLERLSEARRAARDFTRRFGEDSGWSQRFQLEEGQYYLAKKEYERALKIFLEVEKQSGENAAEGAYYAAVTLWQQNTANPAPESASRALAAKTGFLQRYGDSPYVADVSLTLGNYHFHLHNYLQAAGAYRRVLESGARAELVQQAIWLLLQSYQRAHEYDAAHRVAEQLLRDFPDHPRMRDAQLEIGIIFKEKGQFLQAIAQFEKVLEWAEGNQASEARFYIGESYQNMGEYRRAIEAYYRVSFYGADGFSQWITSADFRRAQCHESLGEYRTAIAVYERIVQREGRDRPQGALAAERIDVLRRQLPERGSR